jgi:hypothetical protein
MCTSWLVSKSTMEAKSSYENDKPTLIPEKNDDWGRGAPSFSKYLWLYGGLDLDHHVRRHVRHLMLGGGVRGDRLHQFFLGLGLDLEWALHSYVGTLE